jgi:hypothetical protein
MEGRYVPAGGIANAQQGIGVTPVGVPADFSGDNSSVSFCFLKGFKVHADVIRCYTARVTKVEEVSHSAALFHALIKRPAAFPIAHHNCGLPRQLFNIERPASKIGPNFMPRVLSLSSDAKPTHRILRLLRGIAGEAAAFVWG